ncbi:RNA polymerase subunit sigma-70 [Nocardia blacklockiae]|uniref:RNA polymerase subunit sigma-70 n=1 Tax=Nocardia blacklockiae TaxID=480036 RepID=UPI001892F747|nr:RNA polymerase subunit sigma-70 [Nocardia blacklockiae]MBF6169845.1 RNA polymerase subunit sigma-70 [Nocardia blacklockiae]
MNPTTVLAPPSLERDLAALRQPLFGYCYRMLGSALEAEDAVQETLMRAWRSAGGLADPAGLRPWVYRIATNVCIDAAGERRRRALPMDLVAAADPHSELGPALPESTWLQPFPTALADDPSERAVSRESVRLAFVATLQHLLPRQRAVLILRDVLCWRAAEVAELLDTSVDAVNSMLRRARSALAAAPAAPGADEPIDTELLERYVTAFERFDIDGIVALLRHDAVIDMPPVAFWLSGREAFRRWLIESDLGCRDKRLVPTEANGSPAVAVYRDRGDRFEAVGIQVLECAGGEIVALHAFLQPELFPLFGLPATLG